MEEVSGDLPSDFDEAYHDPDDLINCISAMIEEEKYCKMIMKTNKEDEDFFESKLSNLEYSRE